MHVTSDPSVHAVTTATPRERLLRIADVETATGCKKSTIYKLMREGRFPARVRITARYAVWPESAVMAWVHARISGAQECKQ
ncbi:MULTISPECIES: AlpA family transcriptional regulator [unclassified Acidovorax]|uniref:helix-turn-helix transcriptional regulator n=1 Tax=unclassified Acidovorax TaxID=2684926 RepID=UPI000C186F96|nr:MULTISPECIES: AlpA family phage regulatory protein [unclassified Acidovorax]PIF16573.1 AlpA family transcriptional regulator [Acidovorax sp. 59]PKW04402.1 AlpA family transcriptional regulator [Acidovorax sp. 30]